MAVSMAVCPAWRPFDDLVELEGVPLPATAESKLPSWSMKRASRASVFSAEAGVRADAWVGRSNRCRAGQLSRK